MVNNDKYSQLLLEPMLTADDDALGMVKVSTLVDRGLTGNEDTHGKMIPATAIAI